ncbi:DUF1810 domain-containing protein [Phenylobacterium hankyongense]|uniref:DUF1810 domain-containing protein n=1 Tax=Phenylobacterium hankyongense TaxID=1813876 RepID=A0A328AXT2_9CAUL|nr:DUF1810 domain-containing protein [Phenylobacterium hankyongense]RAK58991.1 DUF1810 domain-containing protein [Phenylobacterium hankyongense]
MDDPFRLQRFVDAQSRVYATALGELRQGHKRTHWMWFIFPQVAGLGLSSTAEFYAIRSAEEARAYLAHPVLGPRLLASVAAVNALEGRTAQEIFGFPDDLKFCSSMTLFAQVAEDPAPFRAALAKYYEGAADPLTLDRLVPG